jgi:hypothetical protein
MPSNEKIEALLRACDAQEHDSMCAIIVRGPGAGCDCGISLIDALAAAVRAELAREPVEHDDTPLTTAMDDAAHVLENLRTWGGMGWTWYQPTAGKAWKILTDALAVARAAMGESK